MLNRANSAKKRLYLTLKGRLSMSDNKNKSKKSIDFNTITDLTKYLPVSEENCHMKKWLVMS
ncbi:MAG: hypothetical protein GY749_49335 [Desulfobacteraceae bacterium]|nr:hypothetical protein [Desulfobacteraceae bacterium]